MCQKQSSDDLTTTVIKISIPSVVKTKQGEGGGGDGNGLLGAGKPRTWQTALEKAQGRRAEA